MFANYPKSNHQPSSSSNCNNTKNSFQSLFSRFIFSPTTVALSLILVLSWSSGWGQAFTGTYSFSGTTGNVASLAYNGSPISNLTVSSLVKTGVTTSSSSGNSRATGWDIGSTNGGAAGGNVNTGKYYEFSITAGAGYTISNPTLSFGVGRSATGPRRYQWRWDVDTYGTPLTVSTVGSGLSHSSGVLESPDANSGYTGNSISTTTSGKTTITFRFYAYGAEAAAGTGGLQGNLTFGGTLTAAATPTISTTGSLSAVNTTYGTASASPSSFNVSGASMTAGILVTPPAGFEVSQSIASGYGATTTVGAAGTIASTPVYVRLAATSAVASYSGNIVLSSSGATSVNVATVSSSVSAKALTVTASDQTKTEGSTSPTTGTLNTHFTVSGLVNGNTANQATLAYSGSPAGDLATATPGTYTITPSALTLSSGITSNYSITYNTGTLTVNAAATPTLSSNSLTAFGSVCTNTTAGPNSFTITGSSLTTANVTVASLTGYTFSTTSGGTYTSTLSLTQPGGAYSQTIYVKFTPTTATSFSGNIVVGGGGASNVNVAASGDGTSGTVAVTTTIASSITTTTASTGGTAVSSTCGTITAKGVAYGTSANPTTPITSNGTGTADFTSSLSGLTANTVYNYRAYATNSNAVTSYGSNLTFTTLHNAPNIGSGSGATQTAINTNWTAPTVAGSATFTYEVAISTAADFSSTLATQSSISSATLTYQFTGLTAGTTYYFRVRAVNAGGNSAWSGISAGYATLSDAISLTALGTAATENFNTLANSGTSSTMPTGWFFSEAGGNTIYTAGTGSGNTGDTYSFGLASNSDRALGSLLSGSVTPTIGAKITNATGSTIDNLVISYTGETWRVGAANRSDRLDFQYSLDATSLTSGTWLDFNTLDYANPGQSTGNGSMQHSSAISDVISGLSISNGSTFWIRWNDFNASSSDDGMAIDDFSIKPCGTVSAPAASAQGFCSTASATVASLVGTGTAIQWYSASTGGTALATGTTLATGTYYATQTLSGCESVTRTGVAVTITTAPNAGTLSGTQAICLNGTTTFTTDGNAGGAWTSGSTGFATVNSSTGVISPVAAGTSTITYTVSGTGGCSNATAMRTVTVNDNPTAPTASPQSFCSADSPTISDLVATGSSIQWYSASTGGLPIATSTALSTGTYYATQTVTSCESTTRTSVSVTINSNGTWIGGSSGNWDDINNWCGGIPNSNSVSVSIPSGVTVNLDTSPSISELTIATTSVINAGNNTITIANGGAFTNNGTFNAQTGTVAFSGTGTLAGNATAFNNLTTNGNLTLSSSPIINGLLNLNSGTLTVGANTLNINGSISLSSGNIDASNASATVLFGGSTAQTIPASTFTNNINNLTLNNSAGLTTNQGLTVANTLNLVSGILTLGANNLTLTGSLDVSNSGSSTAFINTNSSGAFIRSISSTGIDYKFPVGLSDYAPISVNFTGGTIASSTLASRAVSGLHPEATDGAYIRSNLYWEMNQSGMTNPQYNVSFTYPGVTNGVGSSETEANLLPAKWSASTGWLSSGSCAICYNGSTMGTSSINTTTKTVTWNGVSGFSDFGGFGEGNGSPLPVELLSFNGICDENQIQLTWSTASENNSDYFEILKSQDGENWRAVNKQAAAGFSTTIQMYSFTETEKTNNAYYRLNQVDFNGDNKMYDPIFIDCEGNSIQLITYPNPSKDGFNVVISDKKLVGESTLIIRDAMGKMVLLKVISIIEGTNIFPIEANEIDNGVYFITIESENGQSKVIRQTVN